MSTILTLNGNAITVSGNAVSGNLGMDTSDATVTSGAQILYPYTAYADDVKYTGSIQTNASTDITVSGATVTVPAGYYASSVNKSVTAGSATTPATTISSTPTMSFNSSTGVVTATNSKTQSVTPTVSAGYVSSGTAGTITVGGSNTYSLTTKSAGTYYPMTSDQTISANRFLTGAQTFKGVTTTNLTAANIKSGVTVEVGDSSDSDRVASVTGTYEGVITRLITNDDDITPSGTYATSTYYNTSYGVKIGYMYGGDIILSMQGGTTTSYEYLYFQLGTVPSGVTLANVFVPTGSSSYVTGYPGIIYACVISGLTSTATMSITINSRNGTYDCTVVTINITAS